MFTLFDPEAEVRITAGNLPHWFQPGVTYFVTFRTDDSVPKDIADEWHRRRDDWLRRNHIEPDSADWPDQLRGLSAARQHEFHSTFSWEYMAYLDSGSGECVLRRPELARIVAKSLRHFDGDRYHLGDFVVMPNHVHLLVCLLGTVVLEARCYSWKKFTAAEVNRVLGRKGRFWHEESFDHLVRSPEQFEYLRGYIADNPVKAGLRPGEYLHWHRGVEEK